MTDIGFRPILDRIIVRRDAAPEMIGSIHLAESTQGSTDMKAQTGVVIAVGPGPKVKDPDSVQHCGPADQSFPDGIPRQRVYWSQDDRKYWWPEISHGDRVVFSRYTGGDIPGHPGCIILRETDVLAVLEGEFTPSITADPKPRRYVGIDKSVR